MNVLILESREDIRQAIHEAFPTGEKNSYYDFASLSSGIFYLAKNIENIDLFILDWDFPAYDQREVEFNLGLEVLQQFKHISLNVPVIVCSDREISIPEDLMNNVLGKVIYHDKETLQKGIKTIMQRLEERRMKQ